MESPKYNIERRHLSQDIFRQHPEGQRQSVILRRFLIEALQIRHGSFPDVLQLKPKYKNDVQSLTERMEQLEAHLQHGVQPVVSMMARRLELADAEPPAASAAYEWNIGGERAGSLAVPKAHDWSVGVNRVIETTQSLSSKYDDMPSRLSYHVVLIERVKNLVKLARSHGKRHLTRAALTISDALQSVYAEDLTRDQVNCICDVTKLLLDDANDVIRDIDRRLRSQGFETIPSDRFRSSVT